jgi:hypothetical protein
VKGIMNLVFNEVHYDDNGKVVGWTEDSMVPVCPSKEVLLQEIELINEALKKETLINE